MPVSSVLSRAQKPLYGPLQLDLGNPLVAGLVFAAPLNEPNGPSYDQGPFRIAGSTDVATPTQSFGVLGPMVTLASASHQALDFGVALAARCTAISISAWIVHDGTAANRVIIGWNQATANGWHLRLETTNVLGLVERGLASCADTATVPSNTLTHVGVTFNGLLNPNGLGNFFVNGVATAAVSQFTAGPTYSAADTLRIGSETSFSWYQGSVAAAYMWNRMLSRAEMADLFLEPFAIFQPQPERRWLQDVAAGPSGTTIPMAQRLGGFMYG